MKRKILFTAILGVFLLAGSSWATLLNVNQQIVLDYGDAHSGSGGEFAVFLGSVKQFETFCLEINEFFSPRNTLNIAGISDYASHGGAGFDSSDLISDAEHDYLSLQTRWLYYNFRNNFAGTGVTYLNTNADAGLLQNAIWYFENEIAIADPGANKFIAAANAAIQSANSNWSVLQQVKVLNLVDLNNDRKQDQLYLSVPEPVSILLFGIGLFCIGGFARKKFKT
jgi:hypothetical protein